MFKLAKQLPLLRLVRLGLGLGLGLGFLGSACSFNSGARLNISPNVSSPNISPSLSASIVATPSVSAAPATAQHPDSSQLQTQKLPAALQGILPTLQRQTQIPLLLPSQISSTSSLPVYALATSVTANRYEILLAFTPDCTGGTACRLGQLLGEKLPVQQKNTPLVGEKIRLTEGMTGYFNPATCGANCSDATLSWDRQWNQEMVHYTVRYTMAQKAGSLEQLKQMANSTIVVQPVRPFSQDNLVLPQDVEIASISNDLM